ncbi:MAG: hypothetical protein R3A10_07925 [Caldilineaceae bacterium]
MATKKTQPKAKPESITMANKDIAMAHEALLALAQMRVPTQTAMKVRRLARAVGPIAEDMQEERRKLIRQHGDLDEHGEVQSDDAGKILFKTDDDREAFTAAMKELLDLQTTLELQPLRATEIGVKEIQPSVLVALGDLLVDDLD